MVLTPIINIIIRKKSIGAFFIIVLLLFEAFNIRLPERIFFESESFIYYLVGCFIGKHYFNFFAQVTTKKIQITGVILFAVITIYKLCVAYEMIALSKAINIVIIAVYALSFWVMTDIFINKITVKQYMNNSFFIYATHVNISAIIIKMFYFAFPKAPLMSIFNFAVCSALTIILICITCKLLNRFTPRVFKILSGNR